MTDITLRVVLRLYPRAWRARYGDEVNRPNSPIERAP